MGREDWVGFGFSAFTLFLFYRLWQNIRTGQFYFNGRDVTREAEPFGFWVIQGTLFIVASTGAYLAISTF